MQMGQESIYPKTNGGQGTQVRTPMSFNSRTKKKELKKKFKDIGFVF